MARTQYPFRVISYYTFGDSDISIEGHTRTEDAARRMATRFHRQLRKTSPTALTVYGYQALNDAGKYEDVDWYVGEVEA